MKILSILAWVSGILFFWTSLVTKGAILGFGPDWWAFATIILVLLSNNAKSCGCCCGDKHCGTCPVQKTM